MINHVYTYLRNRRSEGSPPSFPGEVYVPPTFVPRRLPPSIKGAYRTLFGNAPDRLFLNYRAQQLMRLLHSTELEEYVYSHDSRVTYLPFSESYFEDVFKITVSEPENRKLYVLGTHLADEANGRCDEGWDVTVDDGVATVLRKKAPTSSIDVVLTYSGTLSTPVPLHGTGLSIRFHAPPDGTKWEIVSRARPAKDLATLLSALETAFGERGVSEILPLNSAEPLKTFEKVWREHEVAAYRYSALLLAMIEYVASLPQEV